MNLTKKILKEHLITGEIKLGEELSIKIDQTLTQDSTGTMCYLQLEELGIDKVKTKKSLAYIDHNTLQIGFENADDHLYIQSIAKKYGIYYSRAGNGICHQVHLERFATVGETLIGSDSHTPTAGALGMIAIGAGGLDVALAMSGRGYNIKMPKIVKVNLIGKLNKFVSAKDIILELLRTQSVTGAVDKVFEYQGEALKNLSITQRATITNMGAELGATCSIFPSDDITKKYLKAQNRLDDFKYLNADENASYDEMIEIDLSTLEPLIAAPHSPDNVFKVSEFAGKKVDQVAIGSCTNGSFQDMMTVAKILKNNTVAENVSLVISVASKQTLEMLSENGALSDMLSSGARILESGCGPCIGMGQSPASNAISLRTFNRNFEGRSGNLTADVYLLSPETAAISAINGYITDPREINADISFEDIEKFKVNDNMIVAPSENNEDVKIIRGPNIKPFPIGKPLENKMKKKALIVLGDNITTDHIMPSDANLLPYRSNIPYLSKFCLRTCNPNFSKIACENNGGFIVAGNNYGQGSSREHAALVPLYLGIKAVIAKSFARIHKANLINSGILPLVFKNPSDYELIKELDDIEMNDIIKNLDNKKEIIAILNNHEIELIAELSDEDKNIVRAGGKINFIKGGI